MTKGTLEVCFGIVKHHFVDMDWYVIQTDLVSDNEVGVPGSTLNYSRPLKTSDEVQMRYTIDEDLLLEDDDTRCPITITQIEPVCVIAIGYVTDTGQDAITIDNLYTLNRELILGSRYVPIDSSMEFEAIKCAGLATPYRCVWGALIDIDRREKLYHLQNDQRMTLSSTAGRHFAINVVEPELAFEIDLGNLENATLTKSIRIQNLSQRVPVSIVRLHLVRKTTATEPHFAIVSPVLDSKGHVLEGDSELKVEIRAIPTTQGIFQESLVIEFAKFKVLRHIQMVCGRESFVRHYTVPYQNTTDLLSGEKLLHNLALGRRKRRIKKAISGGAAKRIKLDSFEIPRMLSDVLAEPSWRPFLQRHFPVIYEPLGRANYQQKLHNCAFVEELALFRHFQSRNLYTYQTKMIPDKSGRSLILIDTPNLQEMRPSLLLHDKVVCTPSEVSKKNRVFVGQIIKTLPNTVIVEMERGFEPDFYDISFYYSRSAIISQHLAIDRVVLSSRFESLFPRPAALQMPKLAPIVDVEIGSTGRLAIRKVGSNDKEQLALNRPDLDASQRLVIRNILRGEMRALVYLIRGPPGTGKTTTLIEIILQLMTHDLEARILVCTQSNSAANLMLSKLVESGKMRKEELVRLLGARYQTASIPPELRPYYASLMESTEDETGTAQPSRCIRLSGLRFFRIIVTTTGLVPRLVELGMESKQFTHLIVDEAGQCLEPELLCAITLMEGERSQVVLTGDDRQLGPVVMSTELSDSGYSQSLFERLMHCPMYDNTSKECNLVLSNQLNYNYRSIPSILALFNSMFYNSQLRSMVSCTSKELDTLKKLQVVLPPQPLRRNTMGIFFYSVVGVNQRSEVSPSWLNPAEANVVMDLVDKIMATGLPLDDIGIVTPYQGQVRYLREQMLLKGLNDAKIGTVEEFQGQERPIIIISAVRSSEQAFVFPEAISLGFMKNPKRLNVAISRAQSLLIIVGNPIILNTDAYWKQTIDYCSNRGSYVTTDKDLLELLQDNNGTCGLLNFNN